MGFGLVLLTSALAASCSSDSSNSTTTFSCDSAKSKCPKDPALTAEQITTCNKYLADPKCGNLYAAAALCLANHQTCAADGTTDQDKTKSFCQSEINATDPCFDTGDAGTHD
jgi:hypothetical protein